MPKAETASIAQKRRGKLSTKFEKHPSRIVFDPASSTYVVTWSTCGMPDDVRIMSKRDPSSCMPSISAICTLCERGCIPEDRVLYAARSIGRALNAGDRHLLDTEDAKKAAELVSDLSSMCVDPNSQSVAKDIGQAVRHLIDEIAAVRFSIAPVDDFSEENTMPSLEKAVAECFMVSGFTTWSPWAMRRRMLYCLNRRERSEVKYTLISLLFDVGACSLLSLSDRRMLRMLAAKEAQLYEYTPKTLCSFFRYALSKMRGMKDAGLNKLGGSMSQQQLVDCISGIESATRY